MIFLIALAVFGIVAGALLNSFMEGRGALGLPWSAGLGIIGSFAFAFVSATFGRTLVGEGPDSVLTIFSAVVGAILLPLIVTIVKK